MKRGGTSLVACITSKYDFTEVGGEFLADAFLAFAYGGCGGVAKVVATDTTKRSSEGIKSQETPLALRLVVG